MGLKENLRKLRVLIGLIHIECLDRSQDDQMVNSRYLMGNRINQMKLKNEIL